MLVTNRGIQRKHRWIGLLILLCVVSCRDDGAERVYSPINHVVVIVVDTLRFDAIGCNGGLAETPNIDRLAAEGVNFLNARTHVPITGPSHASLFTSVYPNKHGVKNNGHVMKQAQVTLAELLNERGFETTAFISLGVLKEKFGIGRGFNTYVDRFGNDWFRDASEINSEVFRWLRSESAEKGLLWVHYSDPHEPYSAPDQTYPSVKVSAGKELIANISCDGRRQELELPIQDGQAILKFTVASPALGDGVLLTLKDLRVKRGGTITAGRGMFQWSSNKVLYNFVSQLPGELIVTPDDRQNNSVKLGITADLKLPSIENRNAYLREVEYTDQAIGELLAVLKEKGWLDSTLLVFTSDHGEGLGEHGHPGHITQLYDSLLRIPLIIWSPGRIPAGHIAAGPAGLIDILPTIADFLGAENNPGWRGASLRKAITEGDDSRFAQFSQTFMPQAPHDLAAIVIGDWKLIHNPTTGEAELYELKSDPAEENNLAVTFPEQTERLLNLLKNWVDNGEESVNLQPLVDSETEELLRALGYGGDAH